MEIEKDSWLLRRWPLRYCSTVCFAPCILATIIFLTLHNWVPLVIAFSTAYIVWGINYGIAKSFCVATNNLIIYYQYRCIFQIIARVDNIQYSKIGYYRITIKGKISVGIYLRGKTRFVREKSCVTIPRIYHKDLVQAIGRKFNSDEHTRQIIYEHLQRGGY